MRLIRPSRIVTVLLHLLISSTACISWMDSYGQSRLPVLESFSPTVGGDGTRILVKGQFFGANIEKITIGGTPVRDMYFDYFVGWRLTVGAGGSGPIVFHTADSSIASKQLFEYVQKPGFTEFSPATGKTGTRITLKGKHFHAETKVFLGGTMASDVQVLSDSVLYAIVSSGFSGKVEVQTPGGKISLDGFSYVESKLPTIAAVSPHSGKPGTVVTITGTDFGNDPSVVHVRFGTAYGRVLSVNPSTITVAALAGGRLDLVEITVNGFVVASGYSFMIESKQKGLLTDTSFRHIMKVDLASPYRYRYNSTDLDGDGLPDLIADEPGIGYKVFRNSSKGANIGYDDPYMLPGLANFWELAIADLDGDGRPDLIGRGRDATVTYRNLSRPGSLRFDQDFADTTSNKEIFRAKDLNADGKVDIAHGDLSFMSYLINQSAGSSIDFRKNGKAPGIFNRIGGYDFSDLNGDGKPEFVLFRSLLDSPSVSLIIHKNITTGDTVEFEEGKYFHGGGGSPESFIQTDLNGDGKIDLIVKHFDGVDYLQNSSVGGVISFAAPVRLIKDKGLYDFDMADMTGDGLPDLVYIQVSDSLFHLAENTSFNNAVAFASPKTFPLKFLADGLMLRDVNNSGYPELITLDRDGDISIYSADTMEFASGCITDLQVMSSRDSLCSGNQLAFTASTVKFKETAVFHWLINDQPTGLSGTVFRYAGLASNDKVRVVMIASAACGQIRDTSAAINVGMITDSRFSISITNQNSVIHGCDASAAVVVAGNLVFRGTTANNFNPSYQWTRNGAAAGTSMPAIQLKNVNTGEQVWLRVIIPTSCKIDTVFSNKVSLIPAGKIKPLFVLAGKTELQTGETTTITASITNPGKQLQYSWYDSTTKHNWQIIPAATRAEIRYSAGSTGDQLRCVVYSTDSCGQRDTIAARVHFKVADRAIVYLPIKIYPNPVTKMLHIDNIHPADDWQLLRLMGFDGRLYMVLPDIRNRSFLRINVSNLAAGTYLLQLMRSTGEHSVIKFVKI